MFIDVNMRGGIYFEDGTYWFGEFKTAGEAGNVATVGVSVYSADDLLFRRRRRLNRRHPMIGEPLGDDPVVFLATGR